MSLCDLGGDVQPQAESLPAGANLSAKEGLEQFLHRIERYWISAVGDAQPEDAVSRRRMQPDGFVGSAMRDGVADQVRYQLSDAGPVAIHRRVDFVVFQNLATR